MIKPFTLAAPLAVLFLALPSQARNTYPPLVPNGTVFSCSTCHISPNGGGARNPFGLAAGDSNAGPNNGINWEVLCPLDSDGDGLSNGVELGDPDCVWTSGAANPGPSRPGDPDSPVNTTGEGEGEPLGEGEGEPAGEGEGEPVGEGEGEPVGEGEGEAPPGGEGEGEGDEVLGCQSTGQSSVLLAAMTGLVLLRRRRR
jgi:uncharacterized protein (TIGR03382 family)